MLLVRLHPWRAKFTTIQGAVIRLDADPQKQLPIAEAEVTASRGAMVANAKTDVSGYFSITFPEVIWPGQTIDLSLSAAGFQPLDLHQRMAYRSTTRRLIIARMVPESTPPEVISGAPRQVVSNIKIRYTVNSEEAENIGSVARTFQAVNQGNVPCRHQAPCSPDGDWKAGMGSLALDAGAGNEYRNVRVSCIAGPCPFTRINSSGFTQGGRTIRAEAMSWSDTATFLLEAEVFHTAIESKVREFYPVIYGRTLNFTLPASQEGGSIEAEIQGTPMIFPLGPDFYLSWATCRARTNSDTEKSSIYRCELKPDYSF